jgi:hypothetical protein
MKAAITRPVALAANVVELIEQRQEPFDVL